MIPICLALCFGGFGALCLSMDRHFEQVTRRKLEVRLKYLLQGLGGLMLLCSAWYAIEARGASVGIPVWVLALTPAASVQMLLLTYQPRSILTVCGLSVATIPLLLL